MSMPEFAKEVLTVNLEDEMRQSYLDYAMSVIVGRALPDVRDGLKPVHRRVLFAMHELGNDWNKAYKKSARIVGDVIGKYHPHGDTAVYDTIVRMAQPFSLRYLLVDGQGNFGSVDGDAPAAMRYTEVRMARLAHALLEDLEKETVDFIPNYDESEQEPTVLPARFPNLLVNGSSGIAVGMATNIPPHNLGEIIQACLAVLDRPEIPLDELIRYIPGPDFPTAGIINGTTGIREAYKTGRGRIQLRARTQFEKNSRSGRDSIVVTELPYQVNKARLLERIAELVKNKKLEGIAALRDESDKDGMRMVIEIKRDQLPDVVLNNLYQHTQMQNVFGINMVCLVDGQPRLLNLKQLLDYFLQHRRDVVTRRTIYDLRKARTRAHLLEGYAVILAHIDAVIQLIKAADNPAAAREALMEQRWPAAPIMALLARTDATDLRPDDLEVGYGLEADSYRLTERQAKAILDLQLQRLTALEHDKILTEFQELIDKIAYLLAILRSTERLNTVIRDELQLLQTQYQDARRTEIQVDHNDLTILDLIAPEDMVVTLSHSGYVKAQRLAEYHAQRRGGKGRVATAMKDEDFIERLFVANSHDTILCFSSFGKVYWLKVHELPQAGHGARGRPIINLLPLEQDERISAILPVPAYTEHQFIVMATSQGTIKKTPLNEFSRPLSRGIIAINLHSHEFLIGVAITDGQQDIMLFTNAGKAIRFNERNVRSMGRSAHGVRGIRLAPEQSVISLLIAEPGTVLTVTEHGYGKRTAIEQFSTQGRGGQGVIAIRTNERNGQQIGAVLVRPDDEIMLITIGGMLVRMAVDGISIVGRNAQGVRLMNLSEGQRLAGVERIVALTGIADQDAPELDEDEQP
jgi:DNA gyrase subunit A